MPRKGRGGVTPRARAPGALAQAMAWHAARFSSPCGGMTAGQQLLLQHTHQQQQRQQQQQQQQQGLRGQRHLRQVRRR